MDRRTEELIAKVDDLLRRMGPIKATWWSTNMGCGFKDMVGFEALFTEAISLLAAIYGKDSLQYQRIIYFYNEGHLRALEQAEGLLIGTKATLAEGLLDDLRSKVLVEIKSDFLETARNLLDDGEKDPASVLASIVLEDSLKRLAERFDVKKAQDKDMGVTASLLLNANVIEKSTNQSIQNFKNLRNASLHAQWSQVSAESVSLLLAFLPMFIEKHGL